MKPKRENFGGRMAVIMAFAGSAIGLGNIWRFPYLVGQNGGAAFILIYIAFTLVLSLPVFLAESAIGRSCQANCRAAVGFLVPGRVGRIFGLLLVFTPLWVVSYYSVVGGWSLDYLVQACHLDFVRVTPDQVSGGFERFIASVWAPVLFHLLFLGATLIVVVFGVKGGIERFCKWTIPALFIIVVVIAVYSLTLPGSFKGVEYLVKPDFSKVSAHTFIDALGQSFFSLSLGMGINITYSSYVKKSENLMAAGAGTAISDLFFALLAGFAILPAVFSAGIEPGTGPTLIFDTLPFIFSSLAQEAPVVSAVASVLFFLAILLAALTSSISLVEVGVAYLTENRGMKRGWACALLFVLCGAFGTLCSLSFGPLSGTHILGLNLFDFADSAASNVLMVFGALVSIVLAAWVMPRKVLFGELTNGGTLRVNVRLFPVVLFLLRYVAPIGILILIASSVL
ncbi:MAG: sodium-dependent transporter [Bacteroidales bacterium]|nr:sodium-dependent transporter [Bacteroidales bacterium]